MWYKGGFKRFCVVAATIACWTAVPAAGQLTARYADGRVPTNYNYPKRDTIFIFNQFPVAKTGDLSLYYRPLSTFKWEKRTAPDVWEHYKTFANVVQSRIDTLSAGSYRIIISNILQQDTVAHDQPVDGGSFSATADNPAGDHEWYRFDFAARKFGSAPFGAHPNVTSSSESGLAEGGYMVKVKIGEKRDSLVAWICMNPGFELKLMKDEHGAVPYNHKFCEFTDFLIATGHPVKTLSFTYYNPVTGVENLWENDISYMINNNYVFLSRGQQQFFRLYHPPYEDTRYTVVAADLFGTEQQDEIMYETIIPHSVIASQLPPEVTLRDGSTTNPASAPVDVRFVNKSTLATEYVWRFGDGDSLRFDADSPPHPDTVRHTYAIPGDYEATLVAINEYGCRDQSAVTIKVAPSRLDIGNVFSPNGDNINDYFKPENTSIRRFEISIYTRAGKRVYQHKGADLRYWTGWDGRIDGGKNAAEGIYYYVIRATGWDDTDYGWKDKKNGNETYRSYVYLYR
ncbi:MAG: gliding motility-associated C-terminal domain-containing protein [Bacteroidales bacterium]|jgi:gliding motility-associated-like protein|nr:gliding motility-associated C-terminal domain-containing protein [Bacteroidales bacterium]